MSHPVPEARDLESEALGSWCGLNAAVTWSGSESRAPGDLEREKKTRSPVHRLKLALRGERGLGKEASAGGAEEVTVLVSRCAVAIL